MKLLVEYNRNGHPFIIYTAIIYFKWNYSWAFLYIVLIPLKIYQHSAITIKWALHYVVVSSGEDPICVEIMQPDT